MLRVLLLCALCIIFTITVYGQSNDQQWGKLETETFEIAYPNNWELDQSGLMGTTFMLHSPLIEKGDDFKENVNYVIQDLKGKGISFEDYISISKSQVPTMFADGRIISMETSDEDDLKVLRMTYEGKQGLFDLIFEGYVFMKDDVYHLLTFTSEREAYDATKETAMTIMNSFKLF